MIYASPRAYELFRSRFHDNLPHPRTIKAWYSNSNIKGDSGLNDEALERLKNITKDLNENEESPLLCSLIMDEMYIRKQIFWCPNTKRYLGYADEMFDENETKHQVANQALTFMLYGINHSFEFPLAYYLIRKMKYRMRAKLILEIITKLTECGIKLSNLTFDGLASNAKMCEELGAHLNFVTVNDELKVYIKNPVDGTHIYIILDACHMEKLVRNTLGNQKVLYDDEGKAIEWKYFVSLFEISKKMNIYTHKLNKSHIEFKSNIMNVRKAVETLSSSVADTMEFLKDQKHPDFVDSAPTIRFIRILNDLFDIFNSKSCNSKTFFKNALNENNKLVIFAFFKDTSKYFRSLKIEYRGQLIPVIKSPWKTAFRGFIINMKSVELMYNDFIEKNKYMGKFYTYALSQDHLEIFFGKIRSMHGHNTNPNVIQYKSAFRKLLCQIPVKAPETANCIAFKNWKDDSSVLMQSNYTNIYLVSSRRPYLDIQNEENFKDQLITQENLVLNDLIEIDEVEKSHYLTDSLPHANIALMAALIEQQILNTAKFYCSYCKLVFHENDKMNDCFISSKTAYVPCESTFKICKTVHQILSIYKPGEKKFNFNVLYYLLFQYLTTDDLYNKTNFENHEESKHKYYLIKCISNEYIKKATARIAKQATMDEHPEILRSRLTKLIHSLGQ